MTVLKMPKHIPDSEAERTEEGCELMAQLTDSDVPLMTTWEVQMICELKEGKACTKIRLKELRECVERITKQRG